MDKTGNTVKYSYEMMRQITDMRMAGVRMSSEQLRQFINKK